jgi:hypothetical protein
MTKKGRSIKPNSKVVDTNKQDNTLRIIAAAIALLILALLMLNVLLPIFNPQPTPTSEPTQETTTSPDTTKPANTPNGPTPDFEIVVGDTKVISSGFPEEFSNGNVFGIQHDSLTGRTTVLYPQGCDGFEITTNTYEYTCRTAGRMYKYSVYVNPSGTSMTVSETIYVFK